MKILNIVGARPNFMKVAPLHRAFGTHKGVTSKIVHTGQHYDEKMSGVFFDQLGLPHPDFFLGVGGGTHTAQTANIMLAFEEIVRSERPDLVLVVGDVNSTIACALVAVKEGIPVAHVEAGLRSGDRAMPEEINRILTDAISDELFVTEQAGLDNLSRENVAPEKIHFVGNVMIDSLVHYRAAASRLNLMETYGLQSKAYTLVTMHRPSNVDNPEGLRNIITIVESALKSAPVVFPLHPRTRKNLENFGLLSTLENLHGILILEPQGYLEFLNLMENARLVITDSGGIQEETTFLGVPCITFRANTERPVTVTHGTNYLVGELDPAEALRLVGEVLATGGKEARVPPLWDGSAAERIAAILVGKYLKTQAN